MEPDFKALAQAWVENDPRMRELDGDRREAMVGRLAEALSRRRGSQASDNNPDVGLVVNVDRDHFKPGGGLSETALTQLTEMVRERIDEQKRES